MSGVSVPIFPPKLFNILHERHTIQLQNATLGWACAAQKLNVNVCRVMSVCLSFFFLESASFFHMWFLEACINKWVLFWSAAVRTGECQRGGDPTALRCMTPGTGSTSWGLLPLSIISPMSRCHMQVSAFWETLYLHRVSADPAVQEIYWFLDWMLGCIKLCDRWFSARAVGWDSLFIKTFASIKHLKTPRKWLQVQSFANEKTTWKATALSQRAGQFSSQLLQASHWCKATIATLATRRQPLASCNVLWR